MAGSFAHGPHRFRRHLIKCGGLLTLAGLAPRIALGKTAGTEGERAVWFHNIHTGENLKTVYWAEGKYFQDSLADINHILRDYRTAETRTIAPQLLDLVHDLNRVLGNSSPVHIISGYRSAATNMMLAARSGGVAKHSLHLVGEAIDLRIPGCDLKEVHRAALALRGGGVGYYPHSDFVHVDIGRVRSW